MPRKCACCWHDDQCAINAALVCGESYPSIGARFGMSAMSVHRHEHGCMLGVIELRALSGKNGPHAVRKRLLAAFGEKSLTGVAITAWLRGARPVKIMPAPDRRELEKIDRQLKTALAKNTLRRTELNADTRLA